MDINKLKVMIITSTKQSYQDLFANIMSLSDSNFKTVKAHGNLGDQGNDGYTTNNGKYFQVYAPDDLAKNTSKAIKKMKDDFKKIKAYWDEICKVRMYVFVVNDKFEGVPPHIFKALNDIKNEHKLDFVDCMGANNLMKHFLSLDKEAQYSIVGYDRMNNEYKHSPNDKVFDNWYHSVNVSSMGYFCNYLPHRSNKVKYSKVFINDLHSYVMNVCGFLNEPFSNQADTALICALLDFRKVAIDVINTCYEGSDRESPDDINIVEYWVETDFSYEYIKYKKWVLKSLFYHLIEISNYIIKVRNNVSGDVNDVDYIEYHEDFHPSYPIFGDSIPSPALYIGSEININGYFYIGLERIKSNIKKQCYIEN